MRLSTQLFNQSHLCLHSRHVFGSECVTNQSIDADNWKPKIWSDRVVCAGFLTHPRTKPWFFHTPWMSWGVWKNRNFEDCLEKFGCISLHVKKSFFYVLLNIHKIFFSKVTLGQIFWSNSSPAMLLEYINWRIFLKWSLMQNVSPKAILVWQLLFLHSIPDKNCESSFE